MQEPTKEDYSGGHPVLRGASFREPGRDCWGCRCSILRATIGGWFGDKWITRDQRRLRVKLFYFLLKLLYFLWSPNQQEGREGTVVAAKRPLARAILHSLASDRDYTWWNRYSPTNGGPLNEARGHGPLSAQRFQPPWFFFRKATWLWRCSFYYILVSEFIKIKTIF